MQIIETKLYTAQLTAQKAFYVDTLGFQLVEANEDCFTVQAGHSRLTWCATPDNGAPAHHIAFNIPPHQFEEALIWIQAIVPLLPYDGRPSVHFTDWDAHAFYFADPAGHILEFIGRERTPAPNAVIPFSATNVLGLGEVGLAVDTLPNITGPLQDTFNVPIFDGKPSGTFCAMGNDDGLLIVVQTGRPWIPTDICVSNAYPVTVTFAGDNACEMEIEGHRLRQVVVE